MLWISLVRNGVTEISINSLQYLYAITSEKGIGSPRFIVSTQQSGFLGLTYLTIPLQLCYR